MWYQYLSVAFYGWSRDEKESVEVDSELNKPSKPSLTHPLMAHCHHCHELGRAGECPDQTVPKVTTKIVHGEVAAHGQHEVRGGQGELIEFSPAKPGASWASFLLKSCVLFEPGHSNHTLRIPLNFLAASLTLEWLFKLYDCHGSFVMVSSWLEICCKSAAKVRRNKVLNSNYEQLTVLSDSGTNTFHLDYKCTNILRSSLADTQF